MRKQLIATLLTASMLVSGQTDFAPTFHDQANFAAKNVQAEEVDSTAYEGYCGPTAKWKFDKNTGTLTISGSGAIYDYELPDEAAMDREPDEDYYCHRPWDDIQKWVKEIKIGNKITYVGELAFAGCGNVKTITIGKKVTEINQSAFYECYNVTNISILGNVKKMGTDIFDKYRTDPQIKQIFIGADVSTLNTEFLSSSLKSIQVESGNKNFCVENNILMNKKKTKIIATGTPEKGIFTVPSTVKQIDFTYINKGEISEIRVEDGNSAFYIKDNTTLQLYP